MPSSGTCTSYDESLTKVAVFNEGQSEPTAQSISLLRTLTEPKVVNDSVPINLGNNCFIER